MITKVTVTCAKDLFIGGGKDNFPLKKKKKILVLFPSHQSENMAWEKLILLEFKHVKAFLWIPLYFIFQVLGG